MELRLALRLLGWCPAGVTLDGEVGVERRKPELRGDLVQVLEVGKVIDLRQNDRLSGPVEARLAKRVQVVEGKDVGRCQPAPTHGKRAGAPVVVEATDAGGNGCE